MIWYEPKTGRSIPDAGGEYYIRAPLLADEEFDLSRFYEGRELIGFESCAYLN